MSLPLRYVIPKLELFSLSPEVLCTLSPHSKQIVVHKQLSSETAARQLLVAQTVAEIKEHEVDMAFCFYMFAQVRSL